MNHSPQPEPAPFVGFVLVLPPSRFRQLIANIRIAHSHTNNPLEVTKFYRKQKRVPIQLIAKTLTTVFTVVQDLSAF